MKSLLTFRITVDNKDIDTPVHVKIKLYNKKGSLAWRIDGEDGDECETLPRPASIAQAKADVRAVYPANSPFHPVADWL